MDRPLSQRKKNQGAIAGLGANLRRGRTAAARGPVEPEDLVGSWDHDAVQRVDGFGSNSGAGEFNKAIPSTDPVDGATSVSNKNCMLLSCRSFSFFFFFVTKTRTCTRTLCICRESF